MNEEKKEEKLDIFGHTNILIYIAIANFFTGVIDAYIDYDKFTFLWFATAIFIVGLTIYFEILETRLKSERDQKIKQEG